MRSPRICLSAAMALVALGTTSPTHAQMAPPPIGQYAPPITPYIGLLRGGASPGLNWMNFVQPQIELFGAANQLQAQQTAFAAGQGIQQNAPLTTGHLVTFGSYAPYYNPRGILGIAGGGTGLGGIGGSGNLGIGGGGMGMGMGGMGMGMGGMGMGGMGMGGMGMGGMGMGAFPGR